MGFEEDVAIDKNALDWELARQGTLYRKWSLILAEAIREKERAEESLDLVKAELDYEIRLNPEDFGFGGKPTEPGIKAAVLRCKRYQDASDRLIEANYEVNSLESGKWALDHKKVCLTALANLYVANYWAEPMVRHRTAEELEDREHRKEVQDYLKDSPWYHRKRANQSQDT